MVYANFGGRRECIMGDSKIENTENNNCCTSWRTSGILLPCHEEKLDTKNNLNTVPYIELQEFHLL